MFSYKSKQSATVEEYRSSCPTRKLNSGCRASNYSLFSHLRDYLRRLWLRAFGKLPRYQLYGIVLLVWTLVLVVSPVWLCHFRCGPLQRVWRSLTYRKKQPFDQVAPGD
jgi:hypothetical protein